MSEAFPNTFVLDSYQRTQLALELLVQNCLSASLPVYPSRKALLKERMTVRITSHRQAGHTTAAITVARKYFWKPAFVFYSREQAETIAETNNDLKRILNSGYVATYGNFERVMRGIDPDCIIVEIASLLSQSKTDALYDLAASFPSLRCLIMIQ